jgi:hypothetical protein
MHDSKNMMTSAEDPLYMNLEMVTITGHDHRI